MADGKRQSGKDTVDAKTTFTKRSDEKEVVPAPTACIDQYVYKTDYTCIGSCLIINNNNFDHLKERTGTDVDSSNAVETFSKLGYNVTVAKNQTVSQMNWLLYTASQQDHSNSASFACVLLSHGDEGVIYGTDGTDGNIYGTNGSEKLEVLMGFFKGDRCRSLVGKPKLFFIQACRGKELDEGSLECDAVDAVNAVDAQTSEKIPVEADFLYAYSTAPGYFSWRSKSNGSWFMQALCEMLQRYSGQLELMHIMTRVNHKVARGFKSNRPGSTDKKQISCMVTMLTNEFYFPQAYGHGEPGKVIEI